MLHYVLVLLIWQTVVPALSYEYTPAPLPLLLPDDINEGSKSKPAAGPGGKLRVSPSGAEFLSSLDCVAPVVVIGPYRSGKSFTLNQLLTVDCEHGFGVGHTRATQTRGVWVWGVPQPITDPTDDTNCSMVYVDTEGFESAGRSNAYDDRIFAISTLLSSLLIYNLPEAIRESDIAKLSFAVQLAEGLFSREQPRQASGAAGSNAATGLSSQARTLQALPPSAADQAAPLGGSFEPGAMLWLIQRDFLQGSAAAQAVQQALAPVPNPQGSNEVSALNRVRSSLGRLVRTSTGYSLPQPHLHREQLCSLPDSELDASYRTAREGLRAKVKELVRPKMVGGKRVTGAALVRLLSQLVELLNSQEMPSVANMLDTFNRQQMWHVVGQFRVALQALRLPVDAKQLAAEAARLQADAVQHLKKSLLGNVAASSEDNKGLLQEMQQALEREERVRSIENQAASDQVCGQLEARCEEDFDRAQHLPAMRMFMAVSQRCEARFNASCAGPGKLMAWQRLQRTRLRSIDMFKQHYNERLHTGLLVLLLAAALLFRCVVRVRLLEAGCWVGFLGLQIGPQLTLGGAHGMYQTQWWSAFVHMWETSLLLLGLDQWWGPLLWLLLAAVGLVWRVWSRRRRAGGSSRGSGNRSSGTSKARSSVKDLDV